jgi:hypothetical protein
MQVSLKKARQTRRDGETFASDYLGERAWNFKGCRSIRDNKDDTYEMDKSLCERGFMVKRGRGRKRILSCVDEEAISKIISNNFNITIKQLIAEVEKKLKIKTSRSTLYRVIQRLGFAYITPRAEHYKKDPRLAEDFKKKS